MLVLGSFKVWREWKSAGASFLISPLDADVRLRIVNEVSSIEDTQERTVRYQQLVGHECLHDWKGIGGKDDQGNVFEVPFSKDRIDELMKTVASDFVMNEAAGLGVRFVEAVGAAGNASSGGPSGTAAEAPKP